MGRELLLRLIIGIAIILILAMLIFLGIETGLIKEEGTSC